MFYGMFHYTDGACSFGHIEGPFATPEEAASAGKHGEDEQGHEYYDTYIAMVPEDLYQRLCDERKKQGIEKGLLYIHEMVDLCTVGAIEMYHNGQQTIIR